MRTAEYLYNCPLLSYCPSVGSSVCYSCSCDHIFGAFELISFEFRRQSDIMHDKKNYIFRLQKSTFLDLALTHPFPHSLTDSLPDSLTH